MAADPETASARRYGAVTKIFWYLDVKYFCVSSVWVVLIAAEVLLPIPGSAADQRWRWRAALEERGCNLDKLSWLVFSNLDIGTRIFHTIRIYEEFLLNRHLKTVLPAEIWTLIHKDFPSRRVTEVDTLCIKVKIGESDKWSWLFLQSAPPLTMGHHPHLPPYTTTEVTAALHWTQPRGDSCSLQSRCSGAHQ